MKKNYQKKLSKNVLEDLKVSVLNLNFVMIYITQKMLVLLKNYLNYLKNSIFECFLKEYNRLLFFFNNFLTTYKDGKSKS